MPSKSVMSIFIALQMTHGYTFQLGQINKILCILYFCNEKLNKYYLKSKKKETEMPLHSDIASSKRILDL